jgi:hypothetical protein
MERGAVYRRALAPIMLTVGCLGLAAALVGWKLEINTPRSFITYWFAVAIVASIVAFALVRRQAIQAGEPIWSPPARRVVQAALPPLTAGLLVGSIILLLFLRRPPEMAGLDTVPAMIWLPLGWVVLYGCALHASGFFLPRGIRAFGWVFVFGGCLLFAGGIPDVPRALYAHGIMGLFFGLLHQAFGIYLYLTEKKVSAA